MGNGAAQDRKNLGLKRDERQHRLSLAPDIDERLRHVEDGALLSMGGVWTADPWQLNRPEGLTGLLLAKTAQSLRFGDPPHGHQGFGVREISTPPFRDLLGPLQLLAVAADATEEIRRCHRGATRELLR